MNIYAFSTLKKEVPVYQAIYCLKAEHSNVPGIVRY